MNSEEVKELVIKKFLEKEKKEPELGKVWVTELVYDCIRKAYYERKYGRDLRPLNENMYLAFGDLIHSVSILEKNEMEVEWSNIKGKIDDYDPENEVLIEKKTCRRTPEEPLPHHVKQVEYYMVLLEKNGFPVRQAFLVYINVTNGDVRVFEIWERPYEKIETEMITKKLDLLTALDKNIPPKRKISWLCNYCPFAKICFSED